MSFNNSQFQEENKEPTNINKNNCVIEKLKEIHDKYDLNNWSLKEKQQLFKIYFIISEKEDYIFNLIYYYHPCDSWEDIFRDYDQTYLKNKTKCVKIAINKIN